MKFSSSATLTAVATTALFGIPGLAVEAAPLRLVIIGDSTVCNYPVERPDRGWGADLVMSELPVAQPKLKGDLKETP